MRARLAALVGTYVYGVLYPTAEGLADLALGALRATRLVKRAPRGEAIHRRRPGRSS